MISTQLFTMLVVMALVTTFMAGPILRLIDPRHELERARRGGAAPGARARRGTSRCRRPRARSSSRRRTTKNLDALLDLAEPLAKSTPPRELDPRASSSIPDRFVDGHVSRRRRARRRRSHRARRERRRAGRARRRRPRGRVHEHPARRGLRPARLGGGGRPRARSTAGGRCSATGSRGARSGEVLERGAVRRRRARRARPRDARDRRRAPGVRPLRRRRPRLGRARARRLDRDRARRRRCGCSAPPGARDGRRATRARCSLAPRSSCSSLPASWPSRCSSTRPTTACCARPRAPACWSIGLSERWRDEGLGPLRSEIVKAAPAPILLVRRGTAAGRARAAHAAT